MLKTRLNLKQYGASSFYLPFFLFAPSSPTCPSSPSTLWLWSRTRSRAWGCSRPAPPCTTRPSSRWTLLRLWATLAAATCAAVNVGVFFHTALTRACVCLCSLCCSVNRSMKRDGRRSRNTGFELREKWYDPLVCKAAARSSRLFICR